MKEVLISHTTVSGSTLEGAHMVAEDDRETFPCETCPMRQKAEADPKSFMARLWKWHTGWCPGWKAYQKHLASQESDPTPT